MGVRVILEVKSRRRLGFVFDDDGVREISRLDDTRTYMDGKPCCLLVSADGTNVYPSQDFGFCNVIIAVTSPNLQSKGDLKNWAKQTSAEQFITPQPSCAEVVYLLYVKFFQSN
jgi:hypothetical protein